MRAGIISKINCKRELISIFLVIFFLFLNIQTVEAASIRPPKLIIKCTVNQEIYPTSPITTGDSIPGVLEVVINTGKNEVELEFEEYLLNSYSEEKRERIYKLVDELCVEDFDNIRDLAYIRKYEGETEKNQYPLLKYFVIFITIIVGIILSTFLLVRKIKSKNKPGKNKIILVFVVISFLLLIIFFYLFSILFMKYKELNQKFFESLYPSVTIMDPSDGAVLFECSSMQGSALGTILEGYGTNYFEEDAYEWYSDVDGLLGKSYLTGIKLSAGKNHTLTVKMTDPKGNIAMDAVNVTVLEDSDCDDMPDKYEVIYGSDPNDPFDKWESEDIDLDGLNNDYEIRIYKTDPFLNDTDGDGFLDSEEMRIGLGYEPPKIIKK